jgi:hypothetical protein
MTNKLNLESVREENRTPETKRSIARKLARPLNSDEMDSVAAGTTSCSCCRADDCDLEQK